MFINANINTAAGRKLITDTLADVQKWCHARTLTLADIVNICTLVTDTLNISKAALKGTRINYTGAEPFPNAYRMRYSPESTHFGAEYNGRTWIITGIDREICPSRQTNTEICLSDTAKAAVLNRVSHMST